jgi:hypothetical protein
MHLPYPLFLLYSHGSPNNTFFSSSPIIYQRARVQNTVITASRFSDKEQSSLFLSLLFGRLPESSRNGLILVSQIYSRMLSCSGCGQIIDRGFLTPYTTEDHKQGEVLDCDNTVSSPTMLYYRYDRRTAEASWGFDATATHFVIKSVEQLSLDQR